MSIHLTTFANNEPITPVEDALVYQTAATQDGIIHGGAITNAGENKLFIRAGHGIVWGRKFRFDEQTIDVELSGEGNLEKRLIIRLDLANQSEPIKFAIIPRSMGLIQEEDVNIINGVWEMELATFTTTAVNITNLKQTFQPLNRNWLKNSQLFKLTEEDGNAKVLVGKNIDELKESGFYFLVSPINAPGSLNYCFVIVTKSGKEIIQNVTGTITGRQFWRILSPNVSVKWRESATREDIDTEYIGSINCNSLPEQKLYYLGSAENCFVSNYVYIYNGFLSGGDSGFQYGFSVFNNKFGYRTFVQGVWKPWKTW